MQGSQQFASLSSFMLGKTCSVNIENARALYGEIVDEVRQQDLLADEQAGALPVAEIGNGKPLGEVKLVRQADDYRVVWSPPEMNVGSDADVSESSQHPVFDITDMPKDDALGYIYQYEEEIHER